MFRFIAVLCLAAGAHALGRGHAPIAPTVRETVGAGFAAVERTPAAFAETLGAVPAAVPVRGYEVAQPTAAADVPAPSYEVPEPVAPAPSYEVPEPVEPAPSYEVPEPVEPAPSYEVPPSLAAPEAAAPAAPSTSYEAPADSYEVPAVKMVPACRRECRRVCPGFGAPAARFDQPVGQRHGFGHGQKGGQRGSGGLKQGFGGGFGHGQHGQKGGHQGHGGFRQDYGLGQKGGQRGHGGQFGLGQHGQKGGHGGQKHGQNQQYGRFLRSAPPRLDDPKIVRLRRSFSRGTDVGRRCRRSFSHSRQAGGFGRRGCAGYVGRVAPAPRQECRTVCEDVC